MAKSNKGGERLFSADEIVGPEEMIEKFYDEATSAETAVALLKFAGSSNVSYAIIRGRSRDDKNLHLMVQMVEGQPCAYVVVDKHDYVLRANADATLEHLIAYLRAERDLPNDKEVVIMLFEKGAPYGNPKTGLNVDIKISWGIKLSAAGELVDYVGRDIEEFLDAVEAWKQELKEKNDKRRKLMGSRLVE